MSRDQDPTAQQWEQAVIDASAVLAGDSDARYQVLSRLSREYLPAALAARTPDADDRVWSSLSSYLRTPATGRKPFALPIEEAEAVVEAIHSIVEQLRKEG